MRYCLSIRTTWPPLSTIVIIRFLLKFNYFRANVKSMKDYVYNLRKNIRKDAIEFLFEEEKFTYI